MAALDEVYAKSWALLGCASFTIVIVPRFVFV